MDRKLYICSDEGIQIYGGMGYSAEAPMELPTEMQEFPESMKEL